MQTHLGAIFPKIVAVVVPVFSVIGGGYLFARWRKSRDLHFVTDFITYVAAPLLVFYSLTDRTLPFENFSLIFGSSLFIAILGSALSFFSSKKIAGGSPAATLTMAFMNSGNMGLPVCYFAFGRDGLAVATIFFVTMSIVHYTLGTALASGRGKVGDALLLPLAPAAILGIAINRLNITLPVLIERPVKLLADSAIPLMLFSLGVRLWNIEKTDLKLSYTLATMRLSIGILSGFCAIMLFGLSGTSAFAVLLQASMPPAVFNFILCEKFNKNPGLAASTILAGTLMSLATIPLLLSLIYLYFPIR
ncbi:MAG: hypothetical protein GTN70_07845 [Deltaproteobacteria bacterium]|nr:hypothetical protein [Deltaproteobacteria bacterium]NIS77610.1 hypothetical protein [Deltaproteobacteria bacterium]